MDIVKEVMEDLSFLKEIIFDKAYSEYRFDGINGPIIGIHGVGGGWTKDGLRSFMSENNVKGVLMSLDYLTKGLDTYLPKIDKEIKKYGKLTIVGFSVGGFLALRYAQLNGWKNINKIITIATPFQGSPKLFSFLDQTLKETLAANSLLQEIINLNPPDGKVVSIFAKNDKFIPNPQKIKLNWPTIVTDAQSHGDVQNHQKWFRNILIESLNCR